MKAPLFHLCDPFPAWELRRQAPFCWMLLLQEASHDFSLAKYLSVVYSAYHHISKSAELTQAKGIMERGVCFWNKTYLKEWTDSFLLISPEKHSETAAKSVKMGQVSVSDPIHFFQPGAIQQYESLWESGTRQCNRVLRVEAGDYANHAIKGLEKGRLSCHFLFVFFTLHTQFLDNSPVSSFVEVGKAVLLAAEW